MERTADLGALHAELKIPQPTRANIRKWVDTLEWPEGSEREDQRNYHITILTIDEYSEEFVEWMHRQIKGRTFEFVSDGLDILRGGGSPVAVLRLSCPSWRELAIDWGDVAYGRQLGPRRFPGGPKAHVTIGFLDPEHDSKPQGIQDPNIGFTTADFNVNINKTSMADDPYTLYHGTTSRAIDLAQERGAFHPRQPREVSDEVAQHYGLDPEELYNNPWFEFSRSQRKDDPHIYLTGDPRVARSYAWDRSEMTRDALRAAHRMSRPELYEGPGALGVKDLRADRGNFANDYYAQNNLYPVVAKLAVPQADIANSTDYQRYVDHGEQWPRPDYPTQDVNTWLDFHEKPSNLNTLMMQHVPYDWVQEVAPVTEKPNLMDKEGAYPNAVYHVSPVENRDAISQQGLIAQDPNHPMFNPTGWGRGIPGNYAFDNAADANRYAQSFALGNKPMDIWRINQPNQFYLEQDPEGPQIMGMDDQIHPDELDPQDFVRQKEWGDEYDPEHHPQWYWQRSEPEWWDYEKRRQDIEGPWEDQEQSLGNHGTTPIAWRIGEPVPPESLEHLHTVEPEHVADFPEDEMGFKYDPYHIPQHAPDPYHHTMYESPEAYQQAVQNFLNTQKAAGLKAPKPALQPRTALEDDSPANEMKQFLDTFSNPAETRVSPHVQSDEDRTHIMETPPTPLQGSHIDPPAHPWEPYDWSKDASLEGDRKPKKLDDEDEELELPAWINSEYDKAKHHWYERAYRAPGSPRPFPPQPMHWRHDHDPSVKATSVSNPRWIQYAHDLLETLSQGGHDIQDGATIEQVAWGLVNEFDADYETALELAHQVAHETAEAMMPAALTRDFAIHGEGETPNPGPMPVIQDSSFLGPVHQGALTASQRASVWDKSVSEMTRPELEYYARTGERIAMPATRKQQLEAAQEVEGRVGPDQSEVVHQFPDGWSVRRPNTYGDLQREGELMGNCFGQGVRDSEPVDAWREHPETEIWERPDGSQMVDIPESPDYSVSLRSRPYYSLRDQDNLPHVSIDQERQGDTALGRHNSDPKPEYLDRLAEWWPGLRMEYDWRHLPNTD